LMYMYVFCIIFFMVLSTCLHTKLLNEGLDNVFALHNIQVLSNCICSISKFVLMFSQCKLLSQ
jgi:hypothetical protein